jgi:ATP-binding cassette subfamily B multidrug efflux pump
MSDRPAREVPNAAGGPAARHGMGPGGGMFGRGGPRAMLKGEKARDFKGTMRKLVSYVGPYRISVVVVFVFAIGSTIFSIVGPKILGKATTKLFEGVMGRISGAGSYIDFDYIGGIILATLALYAISALFAYIQGWIMSGVSIKMTYQLRKDMLAKINRMPLRYFDGTNHGEVLSRMTNDVDTVNQTLSQSLTQIVTSIVTMAGVLAMMLSISWQMTLVALLILPLSLIIIRLIVGKSQRYFREQQDYIGHVNGHVEEMFGSHAVVKAFNGEERNIREFEALNDTLYRSAWKSHFLSSIMMPVMNFVGNIGYVGVTIMGGYLAVRKTVELGDIQAFIQYVRSFTQPVSQIANISNVLQQTAASAERVFAFLEESEEEPDRPKTEKPSNMGGHVEFRDVRFGYVPGKTIIEDFSADIQPGRRVAIVGPTGAGKTTMVKLLMRFYDVDSGAILVDGRDVRDYGRAELRRMFGMVLQDTWLFNGTILDNIRYGRAGATEGEVAEAAKAAHTDHFIMAFPEGYGTVLNEETTNISQGQKQLLTIARAILADPPILILDEATSSVDTHTETLIRKAMSGLMKGRTTFIIAHRLSTVRDADWILVMNHGDIVEQGTHDELLERGGFYAELYNSQFEKASLEA